MRQAVDAGVQFGVPHETLATPFPFIATWVRVYTHAQYCRVEPLTFLGIAESTCAGLLRS